VATRTDGRVDLTVILGTQGEKRLSLPQGPSVPWPFFLALFLLTTSLLISMTSMLVKVSKQLQPSLTKPCMDVTSRPKKVSSFPWATPGTATT
jgi:hypothetical protein